jgi:hypothetical protein
MTKKNSKGLHLEAALRLLEDLDRRGMRVVPSKPSRAMLKAGAQAGDITQERAGKVWKAMLSTDA